MKESNLLSRKNIFDFEKNLVAASFFTFSDKFLHNWIVFFSKVTPKYCQQKSLLLLAIRWANFFYLVNDEKDHIEMADKKRRMQ